MRNALITGGLGLIGSSLAERLYSHGWNVHVVDSLDTRAGGSARNQTDPLRCQTVFAGIEDEAIWKSLPKDIDVVFNFAGISGHAQSMNAPVADLSANVLSQACFLQELRARHSVDRVFFTSTRQVYGREPEKDVRTVCPADVNAVSKLAIEHLHEVMLREYSTKTSVLRLSNVYGAAMLNASSPQGVLGTWLRRAVDKEPIIVKTPTVLRDVLHVDDLVDLLILLVDEPSHRSLKMETFDVGGGVGIGLDEIANHLVEKSGTRMIRESLETHEVIFSVGNYVSNVDPLWNRFGWRPIRDWREEMTKIVSAGSDDNATNPR